MMTKLRLAAAIAIVALLVAGPAAAQTCFQRAGGVPGAYSQPPDWWSPGATPLGSATGSFVDDPRWQGATSVSHIGDAGRFRALVQTVGTQKFLVLSFRVKADASGNGDRLYLGFWDETSNSGNVFRLQKNIGGSPTPVAGQSYADGAFSGRFYHRTDATSNTWLLNNQGGLTPPPLPDWLKNDTRVDVFCPMGTCSEWAIRMRIPIDPAADVASDNPTGVKITPGGTFRFWYQIQEESGVGTAVLYGWPQGLSVAEDVASTTCSSIPPYCFPDPLGSPSWLRVQDGASCVGDISINASQIYANTPGSIIVNLSSTNQFHARPTNNTTDDQPSNAVSATFRIANWGSALFDSPAWESVCTNVVQAAGSAIAAGSGQWDLVCDYNVPDPCAYKPAGDPCGPTAGSRNPDQCLLVDLASASGSGPYHFSPQSAWQNMLFVGASKVTKVAALDTRGAPPLPSPAPNRDLYVYLDVRNMPAKRNPKEPPLDPKVIRTAQEKLAKFDVKIPEAGGIGEAAARGIAQAHARGVLSFEEVQALMPTVTAYVWHDTGRTIQGSGGQSLKLLAPQPNFGMFVWHDGDLHGWRHKFEGSTITEIAPNYYRVSAPNDGVVKATLSVTACETADCAEPQDPGKPPEPTDPPKPWWRYLLILLLIIAVLLALWLLLKKKK